ncbi:mobile mystery protein B [Aphanothece minutissima]|uniref:Mobile mystery protein B n=1 Tax=Aphanothece cf. minutissima CCALA 015 TaxID=2107695 RepID=A0ABX5FC00_9CHRO|nr:mobile mystery protein B [Aphanothece minutissima]PSB39461.1 mobile mystery protein B [Aphanothece cf. minutissima CCALA 015]
MIWLRVQRRPRPLDEAWLRGLHRQMYAQTWRWAGQYRRSDKNLVVDGRQVRPRLAALLGDIRYQIEHRVASADEIAIAFHHRLVVILPFLHGNGRHARLMADVLAEQLGGSAFPWGGTASFMETTELRAAYIDALRCADRGDLELLLAFARMA